MTVFLNGQFMPIEEARIPVLDRGFIFGDGVYEVIPVYSRHAFRLAEHLLRLQHSLDGIRLPNPYGVREWAKLINELIAYHATEDQYLYLHITRGVAKRDHAFPKPPVVPTVFMMSNPLPKPPSDCWKAAWARLPHRTTGGCVATSRPSHCYRTFCCVKWQWMQGVPRLF